MTNNTIQLIHQSIQDEAWNSWALFGSGTFIVTENFRPDFSIRDYAIEYLNGELNKAIELVELHTIRLDDADDIVVRVGETDIYVYLEGVAGGLIADDLNITLAARSALQSDLDQQELVHVCDKMDGNVIRFYRVKEAYGEFSNFARYPVHMDGEIWPTSEHYYQAQKYAGTELEEKVRNAKNAWYAAKFGRELGPLPEDWEKIKVDIMYEVVLAKFTQHPDLRKLLLDTGDAVLIEHTRQDSFWADGGDGTGENWLGKILMMVREDLRS